MFPKVICGCYDDFFIMIKEVITIQPRGFCAGVARSIKTVEDCLDIFGPPIYIKHAIVHNKVIVSDFKKRGAIIVEDVDEIPDGAIAIFSAHGSPPEHFAAARKRNIRIIDATCPLVTKVHMEMIKFIEDDVNVVYIGHKGHVEGIGVIGEAKMMGVEVPIIESVDDVAMLPFEKNEKIAYLTQTTLSINETQKIVTALEKRYPHITTSPAQDICYATTNRQKAVAMLAQKVDIVFIVGSKTSSNSNRLVEVAIQNNCDAYLVDGVEDIKEKWFSNKKTIGISAGASAPEYKVREIISFFVDQGAKHLEFIQTEENIQFTEPIELTRARKKGSAIHLSTQGK